MSDVFDNIIARDPERAPPPTVTSGNPYPPGSEQADWYDRQPKATPPRAETYRDSGGYTDQGVPIGGPSVFGDLPPAGFTPPPPKPRDEYRGSVLPLTRDSGGNVRFDPLGAGPLGSLIEGAKLPGRVLSGEIKADTSDPNFMGQVLNMAGNYGVRANPFVKSGDKPVPGVSMEARDPRAAAAQTPSVERLKEVGGGQMNTYRGMDIPYDPRYIGINLRQQLIDEVRAKGVGKSHAPGLYATIDELADFVPRSKDPTATIHAGPATLMEIRDNIKNHFDNPNEHKLGVGAAYRAFDRFLENPPAEAVLGGPAAIENQVAAAAGSGVFKRGRHNYSAGFRGEDLADVADAATLRNAAAHSGNNFENNIRSRIATMLLNDKRMVGH